MRNPFDDLGAPKLENPRGEEVEGAFSCQECDTVVNVARYLEPVSILTWMCPNNHISKIEGFKIG